MTPHHCRHCGKLLRTWNEREEHRLLDMPCDGPPPDPCLATPEQIKRNERLLASPEYRKMRERNREPEALVVVAEEKLGVKR